MGANLIAVFSELLFIDEIKRNIPNTVWNFFNVSLRIILFLASLCLTAYTLYYGLELITKMWNEYFVGFIDLKKIDLRDVFKFFVSTICLRWIFLGSPKFDNIHSLEKVETYLNSIINRGFIFILTFMAVQLY